MSCSTSAVSWQCLGGPAELLRQQQLQLLLLQRLLLLPLQHLLWQGLGVWTWLLLMV
jgi:hypothetical protein